MFFKINANQWNQAQQKIAKYIDFIMVSQSRDR